MAIGNSGSSSMIDLHIDDFYRDTALILLRLYRLFPRPQILYVDDICGPDSPDEFGLPSARTQACFSAMLWLGRYDYLVYEAPIRQEALDQALLTEKGLLLLSAPAELPLAPPPESALLPDEVVAQGLNNIGLLRQALREGSSTHISHTVRSLLERGAATGS